MAKLNRQLVAQIKKVFKDFPNLKVSRVAKQLGVSYDTIWDVLNERYWKNVQPVDEYVCPHCIGIIETIKADVKVTDTYYLEGNKLISTEPSCDDPDTYGYWCHNCGGDLTPFISVSKFKPRRITKEERNEIFN